jgi:hypothetical protein
MKLKKEEGVDTTNVRVLAIEKCIADPSEKEYLKILT